MGRVVVWIIMGSLVVCVACASLGFVLWRRAGLAVSNEMANVVATQVVASINSSELPSGQLVLTEYDLDVNNVLSLDGSCGFEVINSDAQIYGVTTEITPTGITFGCDSGSYYSAIPVVEQSRVELTKIEASSSVMSFIFSKDKLEQGVEQGINSALEAKGLTPVSLTLKNGSMIIVTEEAVS